MPATPTGSQDAAAGAALRPPSRSPLQAGDDPFAQTRGHVHDAVQWMVAMCNGYTDVTFDEIIRRARNATSLIACAVTAAVIAAEGSDGQRPSGEPGSGNQSAADFVEALRLPIPNVAVVVPIVAAANVSFDRFLVLELCIIGLRRGVDAFLAAARPAGGTLVFRAAKDALDEASRSFAGGPSWLVDAVNNALAACASYEHPPPESEPFETLLGTIQTGARNLQLLLEGWEGHGPSLHPVHDSAEVRRLCDCVGGPSVFYQRWRAFAPIYEDHTSATSTLTSVINTDRPLPIALLYRPPFWFPVEETVLRHGAAPVVTLPCLLRTKCYVLHSYSTATTMALNATRSPTETSVSRSDFATEYEFCGLLSPHLALVRSHGSRLHFADPTVLLPGGALATLAEIAAVHGRVATATSAAWPQLKLTFVDDHVSCSGDLLVDTVTGVGGFRFGEHAASKLLHNAKLTTEDPDFDPLNASFASADNVNQTFLHLQPIRCDEKLSVLSWMLRNNAPPTELPRHDMSAVTGIIPQEVIAGLVVYTSHSDDTAESICTAAKDYADNFLDGNLLILVLDAVSTDAGCCALLEQIEERTDHLNLSTVAKVLGVQVAAAMACVLARRGDATDIIEAALEPIPDLLSIRFPQGLSVVAAACRGGHFEAARKMFAKIGRDEHIVAFLDATNMAFFFAAGDPQIIKKIAADWMPVARVASPAFRAWTGNPFAAMSSATALRGRLKFNATPCVEELQALMEYRLQLFIADADVTDLCAVLREWQQFNMPEAKQAIEACIRCVFDHPRTNLQHLLRAGVIKKLPKGCKRIGEMLLLMSSSVKCCTVEAIGNVLLPIVTDPSNNPFKYPLHLALTLSTRESLSHEFNDAGKRFWELPTEGGPTDDVMSRLSRTDAIRFPNIGALSFTLIKCHPRDPCKPQVVSLNAHKSEIVVGDVALRISKFAPMLPGVLRNIVELSPDAVAFAFVYPSPEKGVFNSVMPTLLDSLILNGGLAMVDKKRNEVVDLVALTDAGNDMLFEGPFIVEQNMEMAIFEHTWRDVRVDPLSINAKKTWEGRLSRVGVKRYQWADSDVIAPMGGFVFDMGEQHDVTPTLSVDHSLALQTSRIEDPSLTEDPFALITVAGSLIFNPPTDKESAPPRYVYFSVSPNPPSDGGAVNSEAISLAVEVIKAMIEARDQWAEMFCAAPPLTMGFVYPLLSVLHLINSTPLELAVRLHCLPVIRAILEGPTPHVLWQVHDTSFSAEGAPLATSSQLLTEAIRLLPLSSFDLRSFTNIAQSTALALKLPVEQQFCRGDVTITVDKEGTDRLLLSAGDGYRPQPVTQPEVIDPIDEQRPVSSRIAFALPTEGAYFPNGALVYLDWSNMVLRADALLPPAHQTPGSLGYASPTTQISIPMPVFDLAQPAVPPPNPSPPITVAASVASTRQSVSEHFTLVGPVDASYVRQSDVLWSSRPSCPKVILNSLPKGATVVRWGWLSPGSAPSATPSGAFVLQLSSGMLHAFAIASEVRVWEPRRASRNGADQAQAQTVEPQQWSGDPLPRPLVAAREAVVRVLIEHCIEHGDGFGLYSDDGKVDVTVLALLLQYGAENLALLAIPHVAEKVAEFTNTSVDALLRASDESRVALLFPTGVIEASGFTVHVLEDRGLSLLHWAALFGSVPMLKTVLGLGSKGRDMGRLLSAEAVATKVAKQTALHFAAYSGSVECTKLLLDFKPMREAINVCCVATWMLLRKPVAGGVPVDTVQDDHIGPTALHVASFFLNMNAMQCLVAHGADPTLACEVGAPGVLVNPYCVLLIRQYVNAQSTAFEPSSIDLPVLRSHPQIKMLIEKVGLKLGLLLLFVIGLLLALVLWYHNLLTAPELLDNTFQQGFAAIESLLSVQNLETKEDFLQFIDTKLWSAVASARTAPLWTSAGYETVASLFLAIHTDCVSIDPTQFSGLAGTEAIVNVERRIQRPVTVRSPSSDIVYSWQNFDWIRVAALTGTPTLPDAPTIAPNASAVIDNFLRLPLTASVGSCNVVAAAMLPVAHKKAEKVYIYVVLLEMMRSGLTTIFIREEGLPIGQLSYSRPAGQQRAVAEGLLWLVFVLSLCRIAGEIAGAVMHWIDIIQPPDELRWPRTTVLTKDQFLRHLDLGRGVQFVISRMSIPLLLASFTGVMLSYGIDVFGNYASEIALLDTYDDAVKAAADFSPDILVVTWLIRSIRLTASYYLFALTTALTYAFVFIPRVGPYIALMRVIGSLKVVVFLAMGAAIAFSFALSMYVAYPGVSDLRSLRLAFLKSILSINSGWQLAAEGAVTVDSDSYNLYYIGFNYYVTLIYVVLMWVAIWSDFDRGQQEVHVWWTRYIEGWYKEWLLFGHNDASDTTINVTSQVQINHERAVFAKLA